MFRLRTTSTCSTKFTPSWCILTLLIVSTPSFSFHPMPVESASRRCLLDWAWILSKRRIPHIAAVLDDIVCTALCDISDMFRRVLLATSISISCRKFTNVRSCCAGVPSSSLHPLSIHTVPSRGKPVPNLHRQPSSTLATHIPV